MKNQSNQNPADNNSQKQSTKSQEEINGFLALKRLKQTEEQIETLKRRFKVLQVKDQEARSKTIQHERQIRTFKDIQQQKRQIRRAIENAEMRRSVEVDGYKQKNKKLKEQIESKIKATREQMSQEKKEENKSQRKKHFENEKKYAEIKVKDVEEKQKCRNRVVQIEMAQKERIERYKESRIKETLFSKSKDASVLVSKTNQRERELQQLSKLEEELAKRSAESIQVSEAMRSRLSSILTQTRRSKLPEIRSKGTSRMGTNTSTNIS